MKPPIGILPRTLHEIYRMNELSECIKRYEFANFPVDPEWRKELAELKLKHEY